MLYSVLIFYVIILFLLLFMKRYSFRSINMIPFHTINSYLLDDDIIRHSFSFINIAGNIVLFIPLGGYITLFNHDKRLYKNLLFVIIFSVIVEIIQYAFRVGVSDIDDVILNGLLILKDKRKVRHTVAVFAPIVAIVFFVTLFIFNA